MRKTKKVTVSTHREHHMGDTMTQVRNNGRMTQEKLADRMGVSQQTVSNLEQSAYFDQDTKSRVVKGLGVTEEYFDNYQGNPGSFTVHHIQDNAQAAYIQHNQINPLEELKKAHEENKQLFREKEALIQRIIDKLEAENAEYKEIITELKAELELLKARIVQQEKQIKALQDLLGSNDTK